MTKITGGCQCGAVRYEIDADPLMALHCECLDCKKSSGAGHITAGAFSEQAVRIAGEVKSYSSVADSGATVTRGFCPACGGRLSFRSSNIPGMVAITAGSSVITARFGSLSTSVNATVTAAALQMLRMAPEATMVAGGATTALRALAIYSDGSQTDATELAVWSSDDVSIAAVSNAAGSKGLVRGGTGGSTFIRAQLNGVRGVANITVQAPTLTVVEVAPRTVNIAAGSTTQLRAMAWFSDNTSRDVTEQRKLQEQLLQSRKT